MGEFTEKMLLYPLRRRGKICAFRKNGEVAVPNLPERLDTVFMVIIL
jgi:hypothetical protein